MNEGVFGFPPEPTINVIVSEYDADATHTRARNCQIAYVEMCGGGAGGANGVANGTPGVGGSGGMYCSIWVTPIELGETTNIDIGAGGGVATAGSNTIITNNTTSRIIMQVTGGRASANPFSYEGGVSVNGFAGGGTVLAGTPGTAAKHGGFGPGGGGGGGGAAASGTGGAGGAACSLLYTANGASTGGGAAASAINTNGLDAQVTVRGFGEGAAGGGGGSTGSPGNGGKGIRGSGGGGGGSTPTAGGTGGSGGNGFVRIIEWCED